MKAGIKIAGRDISNFRYVDDTTLMAESEEELKSLLMKAKAQFSCSVVSDSVRPHRQHPTGSSVPGILQARRLEWAATSFSSDFGAPKMKSATVSNVSPSICHEVMGLMP